MANPALSSPFERKAGMAVAVSAFAITVAAQITLPLREENAEAIVTVTVVALVVTCIALALRQWSWKRVAGTSAGVVVGAIAVEYLGSSTGVPFGHYDYSARLQPQVAGVPLVVALAWLAMGIPATCLGRRMSGNPFVQAVGGGAALMAWDLLLDPMMVGYGYWQWRENPGPAWEGIPLINFLGWWLVGTLICAFCARTLAAPRQEPLSLTGLWCWMLGFSVLGFLIPIAFDRPAAGVVAGVIATALALVAFLPRKRPWLAS